MCVTVPRLTYVRVGLVNVSALAKLASQLAELMRCNCCQHTKHKNSEVVKPNHIS